MNENVEDRRRRSAQAQDRVTRHRVEGMHGRPDEIELQADRQWAARPPLDTNRGGYTVFISIQTGQTYLFAFI